MSEAMPRVETAVAYSRETEAEKAMTMVVEWLEKEVSGGLEAPAQERLSALTKITDSIDEQPQKYNLAIADIASLFRQQAELECDFDDKMSKLRAVHAE